MDLVPIVFVVDDDSTDVEHLERLLGKAGFKIESFTSGETFLKREPYAGPNCVITDLNMPGISGLELQAAVNNNGGKGIPFIFLTGQGDIETSVKALKAGALDYLQKPVDQEALLDVVNKALAYDEKNKEELKELEILQARANTLTPREGEVFMLVASGMTNKEVAKTLGTSEKTIKVHRGRVMHKMQANSLAELVIFSKELETTN